MERENIIFVLFLFLTEIKGPRLTMKKIRRDTESTAPLFSRCLFQTKETKSKTKQKAKLGQREPQLVLSFLVDVDLLLTMLGCLESEVDCLDTEPRWLAS